MAELHVIDDLTAYLDDFLSAEQAAAVREHLAGCIGCSLEANSLIETKRRLSSMSRLRAPDRLISRLERKYAGRPLLERIRDFLSMPAVLRPAGVALAGALVAGVWLYSNGAFEHKLDPGPLLAAHSRYQAELLVPQAEMSNAAFSGQLAALDQHQEYEED
ncbi:MAG: zf-HC2 domain-containing protein [Elusimicrobia bacterium]|nr:zf-HC2 domain-containing protein [Elusimicrobiota bacterium]